ncbi:hypothetical protein K445DRAFT_27132 [Daldinia sp. EC12]|nr:hypothetical protein K445DRAFT_27132 [Daldinia sp. EC12]
MRAINVEENGSHLGGVPQDDPFFNAPNHGLFYEAAGPSHSTAQGNAQYQHHHHHHEHEPALALTPTPAPALAPLPSAPLPAVPEPAPRVPSALSSASSRPSRAGSRQASSLSANPMWLNTGDEQLVVRPAPGPFLYSPVDPEEQKRRDEEKRVKRQQREKDRALKKEEKAKAKAAEKSEKQVRKTSSQQSDSTNSATLRTATSFSGSLRRAFLALKKPSAAAPSLPTADEGEGDEEERRH